MPFQQADRNARTGVKGGMDEVARVALGMMVQIRLARGCFA
jgi:hypothetical protein